MQQSLNQLHSKTISYLCDKKQGKQQLSKKQLLDFGTATCQPHVLQASNLCYWKQAFLKSHSCESQWSKCAGNAALLQIPLTTV